MSRQIGAVLAIARAVCTTASEEVEKVIRRAGLDAAHAQHVRRLIPFIY
ncbi:MAG TPA: hypothetical protein VJ860_04045 [Polyangia bacterium]|jgi:hypothetical protein|nr:hypothetical protein [Polyangia bacterium]